MKLIWLIAGIVSLGLGIVGIILPLLPTVPFLLLAAFCFARSSARLHDWLVSHPRYGPPILDWRTRGAISRRAKYWASVAMLAAFVLSAVMQVATAILIIQAVVLFCVAAFIWSRPD